MARYLDFVLDVYDYEGSAEFEVMYSKHTTLHRSCLALLVQKYSVIPRETIT